MTLIANFIEKTKQNRAEANGVCKNVREYISSVEKVFPSKEEFMDAAFSIEVQEKCDELTQQIDNIAKKLVFNKAKLKSRKKALEDLSSNIYERIIAHNDLVAEVLSKKARDLIGDVEGQQLDDQQMKCIIKPAANHLVVAGAGTGKTTTIVGKVKYLLKSGLCEAQDILVLSFTNASALEMRKRINKESGTEIEASTFHKLGLNIINSVEGIAPKITQISLQKFVWEQLAEQMKNQEYLKFFCKYYLFNHKYNKSEFDFETKEEYDEYLQTNPPVTLKGERVKSYGEMDIANFLFENGIDYIYEKEYEIDTRTEERFQYYPDFYLPESGCYIEYFGINEKGDVPSYFTSKNGKTP